MSKYSTSKLSINIFRESIDKYHLIDDVYQSFVNPYPVDTFSIYSIEKIGSTLFNGIMRTNQDPEIEPVEGMKLKRLIDESNNRTDTVEYIDSYFLNRLKK